MKKECKHPPLEEKIGHRRFISRLVACVMLLAFSSPSLFAQERQTFTVDFKANTLGEVFDYFSRHSDYVFTFNSENIRQDATRVTHSFVNATLESILTTCLEGTDFTFEIVDRHVVIKKRPVVQQGSITVRGFVYDEKKQPLPGVTVRVVGTNVGTATTNQGWFSLTLPILKGKLKFSFVGYKEQEIEFSEATDTIRVNMAEEVGALNDVVVTGYQILSKERVTGSFATVNAEEVNQYITFDIASLLEGKVAGIQKEGTHLNIRGRSTLSATMTPLYVIDGFPVEGEGPSVAYNNVLYNPPVVNPEDIESITVLKDAAAASIYGARAANGVIVVTTKKAKQGKAQILLSADVSVTPVPDYDEMNYMSASDYIDHQYKFMEGYPYKSTMRGSNVLNPTLDLLLQVYEGALTQEEADEKIDAYRSDDVPLMNDFEKYIYRPEVTQRYYLSVAKATERNNLVASLTYTHNRGNYDNKKDFNVELSMRNSLEITSWINADLVLNVNIGQNDYPSFGINSYSNAYAPYTRLVDEDGNPVAMPFLGTRYDQLALEQYPEDLKNMDAIMQEELKRNIQKTRSNRTRASLMLNFKLTDWLNFSSGLQYEFAHSKQMLLYDKDSYAMRVLYNGFSYLDYASGSVMHHIPDGASYGEGNTDTDNFTWRNQLSFDYTTRDAMHSVTMLLGSETREVKGKNMYTRVFGYDDETQSYVPVNNKDLTQFWSGLVSGGWLYESDFFSKSESRNRYVSFYGNLMYSYDQRYDLTGSIRWDLSDLFGTNKKYLYRPLWSVGIGWTLSNEKFMEEISWLNRLRLRATYGINGNIARGIAPYLIAAYQLNSITGNQYGTVNTPPNASLRWEKTTVLNFGVDFDFFKSRLNGSVEYYRRKSSDLLTNVDRDPTLGFSSMRLNSGEMVNNGVEVTLYGTPVKKKDIIWTIGATLAYNKNKLTKYNAEPFNASSLYSVGSLKEGYPYFSMWSLRFSRIDENGETVIFDENGEEVTLENITSLDAVHYDGPTMAPYTGSLFTTLSYKGWDLSLNFIYNLGHKMRKQVADPHLAYVGGPYYLTYDGYDNSWKEPGDEKKPGVTPRMTYSYDENTFYRNDHWRYNDSQVVSASYMKLRNLALSYRLPQRWLKNTFLKMITVTAQVNDLFYVTANGEHSDPENYDLNGGRRTAPSTPTYSFGLNVSF